MKKDLWLGLNERTRKALSPRDYKSGSVAQRIAASGVDAAELTAGRGKAELKKVWIPGVEIFSREIHPQRHRGSFGELRSEEHTSELQSRGHLVCRLLLEKKKQ